MNRILTAAAGGVLGVAGALGAAALLTAAPAHAFPGCVPDIACDVIDEAAALPNSILEQPGNFLVGDGPGGDHTGLVNQPERFLTNLAGQPDRFLATAQQPQQFFTGTCDITVDGDCNFDDGEFTGILGQPQRFAQNLAGQPQRFADSIARSIGAFGPDVGTEGDDGLGGTGD